jgi:hypothetical protein
MATRARHERMLTSKLAQNRAERLESLAGFLMRAGMFAEEWDVHLDDLNVGGEA